MCLVRNITYDYQSNWKRKFGTICSKGYFEYKMHSNNSQFLRGHFNN